MSAMTHQNLSQSVRHGMTTLTLTLKYQSHHYHFRMNLPKMVKGVWKEGYMIPNPKNQRSERWKLTTAPGDYVNIIDTHGCSCEKLSA